MKLFKILLFLILGGLAIILISELRYDKNRGFYSKGSQTDKILFAESYLAENFPITINSAKIGIDRGYYYIELSGSLFNNSGNFLDEIIISPQIELDFTTASGPESIPFDNVKLSSVKTGQKINFNERIYYGNRHRLFDQSNKYIEAILRNKINKAILSLKIDGTNSLGFKISNNIEMYPPIKEIDISDEWIKILNL
jgi:hypothetical protein